MVTYGTNPGMGLPISANVPDPARTEDEQRRRGLEQALAYMALEPGQPLLGQKVDVVFIGSCTNGRISDLRLAAAALEGRKVADGVRMLVVPGSDEVKREAEREGLDVIFRAAGADWREAGCSMCIAMNATAVARSVRREHVQPQLRGPPGQGRPDVPREPPDGRRVRHCRVIADPRRLPGIETLAAVGGGSEPSEPWPSRSPASQPDHPAAGGERRHGPDRPGAFPEDHREGGLAARFPRLALRGRWLTEGAALRPRPARQSGAGSCWPATTSAAARRASTRHGRWSPGASRR